MLLEFTSLRREYQREGQAEGSVFAAVDRAGAALEAGDFACVSGLSGSGKSTLLNMLAGLLPPSSGEIIFEGRRFSGMNDRELSLLRNTRIGYIPQGHSILWNFTVLDNIRLPFFLQKRPGDPTGRALRLLEQMGAGRLSNTYPGSLSGGELRRVSIARGLINEPALLIADEPTGDLDPGNAAGIMELFAGAARDGMTVLLVTHDPALARYGNRRFLMERGVLTES
ncbi:MAG: ABC transporter ATP-binding protein [Spirochaetaceae bacterium]|jgi:putative ABC transport system ATP-binding protein|nr:ABC transporter ATP-binding protein [Spirochaetaceae bacterium]